jgi:hypothetical protein
MPAFSSLLTGMERLDVWSRIHKRYTVINSAVRGITTTQYTHSSWPSLKGNMFVVNRVAVYMPGRKKIVKTEIVFMDFESCLLALASLVVSRARLSCRLSSRWAMRLYN